MSKSTISEQELNRYKELMNYDSKNSNDIVSENTNRFANLESDKDYILEMHNTQKNKEWGITDFIDNQLLWETFMVKEEESAVEQTPVDDNPGDDFNSLYNSVNQKLTPLFKDMAIWNPMMKWFSKNSKENVTIVSLKTLLGNQTSKIAKYDVIKAKQSEILNNINKLMLTIASNTDPKKIQLNNLYKLIKSFDDKGVIIKSTSGYSTVEDMIKNFNSKTDKNIDSVRKGLINTYETSSTGSFTISNEEIKRLLSTLQAKVSAKMNAILSKHPNKNVTFESLVGDAITISIKPGKESVSSTEFANDIKNAGGTVYSSLDFQYPPITEADNTELGVSFMEDNSTRPSEIAINSIQTALKNIRKELSEMSKQYAGIKITYVNIGAYASTSFVRTKYNTGVFSKENNVALAKDRADAILRYGENTVKTIFSQWKVDNVITKMKPITRPNIGPEWEKVGGTNPDGSKITIDAYGPLFREAYSKNRNLTPQQFYGVPKEEFIGKKQWDGEKYVRNQNPKFNKNIKTEYESVYSKYRMSSLFISIGLEMSEKEESWGEDLSYEVAYSNNFTATIAWKGKKKHSSSSSRFRIFTKSRPRPATYPIKFKNATSCPIWG